MIKGRGTKCGVKRTDLLNLDILELGLLDTPVKKVDNKMQLFHENVLQFYQDWKQNQSGGSRSTNT